jgi:hypothetical protein
MQIFVNTFSSHSFLTLRGNTFVDVVSSTPRSKVMPAITACNGVSITCFEKSPHISEEQLYIHRSGSITVIDADSLAAVHCKHMATPGYDGHHINEDDSDDEEHGIEESLPQDFFIDHLPLTE